MTKPSEESRTAMPEETKPATEILGNASIYLGDAYPFIKNDVYRRTPERRAAEIICALKDVIELSDWGVEYGD